MLPVRVGVATTTGCGGLRHCGWVDRNIDLLQEERRLRDRWNRGVEHHRPPRLELAEGGRDTNALPTSHEAKAATSVGSFSSGLESFAGWTAVRARLIRPEQRAVMDYTIVRTKMPRSLLRLSEMKWEKSGMEEYGGGHEMAAGAQGSAGEQQRGVERS